VDQLTTHDLAQLLEELVQARLDAEQRCIALSHIAANAENQVYLSNNIDSTTLAELPKTNPSESPTNAQGTSTAVGALAGMGSSGNGESVESVEGQDLTPLGNTQSGNTNSNDSNGLGFVLTDLSAHAPMSNPIALTPSHASSAAPKLDYQGARAKFDSSCQSKAFTIAHAHIGTISAASSIQLESNPRLFMRALDSVIAASNHSNSLVSIVVPSASTMNTTSSISPAQFTGFDSMPNLESMSSGDTSTPDSEVTELNGGASGIPATPADNDAMMDAGTRSLTNSEVHQAPTVTSAVSPFIPSSNVSLTELLKQTKTVLLSKMGSFDSNHQNGVESSNEQLFSMHELLSGSNKLSLSSANRPKQGATSSRRQVSNREDGGTEEGEQETPDPLERFRASCRDRHSHPNAYLNSYFSAFQSPSPAMLEEITSSSMMDATSTIVLPVAGPMFVTATPLADKLYPYFLLPNQNSSYDSSTWPLSPTSKSHTNVSGMIGTCDLTRAQSGTINASQANSGSADSTSAPSVFPPTPSLSTMVELLADLPQRCAAQQANDASTQKSSPSGFQPGASPQNAGHAANRLQSSGATPSTSATPAAAGGSFSSSDNLSSSQSITSSSSILNAPMTHHVPPLYCPTVYWKPLPNVSLVDPAANTPPQSNGIPGQANSAAETGAGQPNANSAQAQPNTNRLASALLRLEATLSNGELYERVLRTGFPPHIQQVVLAANAVVGPLYKPRPGLFNSHVSATTQPISGTPAAEAMQATLEAAKAAGLSGLGLEATNSYGLPQLPLPTSINVIPNGSYLPAFRTKKEREMYDRKRLLISNSIPDIHRTRIAEVDAALFGQDMNLVRERMMAFRQEKKKQQMLQQQQQQQQQQQEQQQAMDQSKTEPNIVPKVPDISTNMEKSKPSESQPTREDEGVPPSIDTDEMTAGGLRPLKQDDSLPMSPTSSVSQSLGSPTASGTTHKDSKEAKAARELKDREARERDHITLLSTWSTDRSLCTHTLAQRLVAALVEVPGANPVDLPWIPEQNVTSQELTDAKPPRASPLGLISGPNPQYMDPNAAQARKATPKKALAYTLDERLVLELQYIGLLPTDERQLNYVLHWLSPEKRADDEISFSIRALQHELAYATKALDQKKAKIAEKARAAVIRNRILDEIAAAEDAFIEAYLKFMKARNAAGPGKALPPDYELAEVKREQQEFQSKLENFAVYEYKQSVQRAKLRGGPVPKPDPLIARWLEIHKEEADEDSTEQTSQEAQNPNSQVKFEPTIDHLLPNSNGLAGPYEPLELGMKRPRNETSPEVEAINQALERYERIKRKYGSAQLVAGYATSPYLQNGIPRWMLKYYKEAKNESFVPGNAVDASRADPIQAQHDVTLSQYSFAEYAKASLAGRIPQDEYTALSTPLVITPTESNLPSSSHSQSPTQAAPSPNAGAHGQGQGQGQSQGSSEHGNTTSQAQMSPPPVVRTQPTSSAPTPATRSGNGPVTTSNAEQTTAVPLAAHTTAPAPLAAPTTPAPPMAIHNSASVSGASTSTSAIASGVAMLSPSPTPTTQASRTMTAGPYLVSAQKGPAGQDAQSVAPLQTIQTTMQPSPFVPQSLQAQPQAQPFTPSLW